LRDGTPHLQQHLGNCLRRSRSSSQSSHWFPGACGLGVPHRAPFAPPVPVSSPPHNRWHVSPPQPHNVCPASPPPPCNTWSAPSDQFPLSCLGQWVSTTPSAAPNLPAPPMVSWPYRWPAPPLLTLPGTTMAMSRSCPVARNVAVFYEPLCHFNSLFLYVFISSSIYEMQRVK
jgi:hypothetical protein